MVTALYIRIWQVVQRPMSLCRECSDFSMHHIHGYWVCMEGTNQTFKRVMKLIILTARTFYLKHCTSTLTTVSNGQLQKVHTHTKEINQAATFVSLRKRCHILNPIFHELFELVSAWGAQSAHAQ